MKNKKRKEVKKMEKSWKNFRLDKNKVYQFIGKITIELIKIASVVLIFAIELNWLSQYYLERVAQIGG